MSAIKVYRIVNRVNQSGAFTGEGAKINGARWNSQGNAMVYLGETQAVTILEILKHIPHPDADKNLVIFELEIPIDNIFIPDSYPNGWQLNPPPKALKEFGDQFLSNGQYLAMRVPSAVSPTDFNILVNPLHGQWDNCVATAVCMSIDLDERLDR